MAYTRKNIAFDNEDDKDILTWLSQQENQTAAIRNALRAYMDQDVITLRRLFDVVTRIDSKLDQAHIVTNRQENIDNSSDDIQENPELAQALDSLGV